MDVALVLIARTGSKVTGRDDFPAVEDIENATATLYGLGADRSTLAAVVIDPSGLVARVIRNANAERIAAEVKKLSGKASGALHGVDLPADGGALLRLSRFGRLGALEFHARGLRSGRSSERLGAAVLANVEAIKTKRSASMQSLVERHDGAEGWTEAKAFLDAFPRGSDRSNVRAALRRLEADPQAKTEAKAAEAFWRAVALFGINQDVAARQQARYLATKLGGTRYGRFAGSLFVRPGN